MMLKRVQVVLIATLYFISVGCVAIFPLTTFAKNIGVYGSIYSISEPDMLNAIAQKLSIMQSDGQLALQKKKFIAKSIAHILRPTPVAGVSDLGSLKPQSHLMNPAIFLNHTIRNSNNDVIALKGTKINPLKIKSFDEALLFIDGDDQKQIALAYHIIQTESKDFSAIKIILVNGDINQTAKLLRRHMYFDLGGVLCKRVGIMHTPTMVYQASVHGLKIPRLEIREFSDA